MIRLGNSARFTSHEIDEFRQVGLDMCNVTQHKDIEQEVSRWALTLADERFDLLEKIASAMAKSKGVNLPPSSAPFAEKPKSRRGRIPFRNFEASRASKRFGGAKFALIAERIFA